MKLRRSTADAPKDLGFGPATQITGRQVATIVLVAMFVTLLIPLGASAAGGLSKVLITDPTNNTQQAHVDASGNLQVGGTVNVGNTPSVSAQQSGSWNVGITGTPTVGLDPSANVVDDQHDPARQAVQFSIEMFLRDGLQGDSTSPYTVPALRRLVVTNVSAQAQLPIGQRPTVIGLRLFGQFRSFYYFPLEFGGTAFSRDFWSGNRSTAFVVEAGDTPTFDFLRDSDTGQASLTFTISGYLIHCTAQLPCN
jgi:hypothetical protein